MAEKDAYMLEGRVFKNLVWAALCWLRRNQATINALNVFPVPDGDTGTNMTLTMSSAWDEIASLPEENVGRLVNKVAHGALMGARGNSGVILSQIWRGFARSLDSKAHISAMDLAAAMREAADTAYKGVVRPVEGTILTVVREVAEEATTAAQETEDLTVILERMVQRAKAAVARTPTLLAVLRQAGVVDSGGQGFLVILEGMWRYVNDLPVEVESLDQPRVDSETEGFHADQLHPEHEYGYGYDVQFIIMGQALDVERVRADIKAIGESVLVVGDPTTVKVHVHVPDPGVPISYAVKLGSLRDVVVEDMQAQYQEFVASRDEQLFEPGAMPEPALVAMPVASALAIGVVTVTTGDGLSEVFRSLGASIVVNGGQTMNPSTAQLLEAVEQIALDQVIILPNNKNILMAAQQAAEVSEKHVAVVPTLSIPQGVAALLMLDQHSSLEDNVTAMQQATQELISAEVTWATRDAALNGVQVREGDAIGLLEGELVVGTQSLEEAVHWLLAEADLEECELVTLYYGEGVSPEQAEELAERLAEAYADMEFELIEGGQPHYPYIISIE